MSKKSRDTIKANLARALEPPAPTRKRSAHLDGLLDEYAPLEKSEATVSQPAVSQLTLSQPNEPPLAGPMSQPAVSQPTASPLNLLQVLPDSAGYTKTPNRYYDQLCQQLTPDEQAVYSQLFRLSHGHSKDTCFISNGRLSERSSVPLSTLKRVVARLTGKGLIDKVKATHGPGKEQGITYRVPSISKSAVSQPTASQPTMGHSKIKDLKENTQTQEGVRAGSRFSIEDCRKYAEHLRATGQGINNPGGYATTIHRTGEADELIESHLAPATGPVDASSCPDCSGTGFYYPESKEKGMAKCRHEKLRANPGDGSSPAE